MTYLQKKKPYFFKYGVLIIINIMHIIVVAGEQNIRLILIIWNHLIPFTLVVGGTGEQYWSWYVQQNLHGL